MLAAKLRRLMYGAIAQAVPGAPREHVNRDEKDRWHLAVIRSSWPWARKSKAKLTTTSIACPLGEMASKARNAYVA
jgi:hypothetical protein